MMSLIELGMPYDRLRSNNVKKKELTLSYYIKYATYASQAWWISGTIATILFILRI